VVLNLLNKTPAYILVAESFNRPLHPQDVMRWVPAAAVIGATFFLYDSLAAFLTVLAVLVLTYFGALLRRAMSPLPGEVEFASVGTAFVSNQYGFWYALPIIIAGPLIIEAVIRSINRGTPFRIVDLFVVAAIAAMLPQTQWALIAAVVCGYVVYLSIIKGFFVDKVMSGVRMFVGLIFSLFVIIVIVPLLR
jgi:hypothetical protein